MRILLFLTATILAEVASAERRPNVLFILADDLGWADTTLYGHTKLYQTPNLERLANRGMTFERAYAASPLCSPTRASILTGQNPARLGLTAPNCHIGKPRFTARVGKKSAPKNKAISPIPVNRLDPKYHTLAERYHEEGYATGHFGKWHLGAPPHSPLENGFDLDLPKWPGPGPAGSFLAPWKYPRFKANKPKEHIEDRLAEEAVAFLRKHQHSPFFLNYWMFSVHAPFDAKTELIEKYEARLDPNSAQRCPTYAAMVESMDDAVGTLLDALDELDLAKNTIIIFLSDNGGNMYDRVKGVSPTSNAPLRGGKATIFEGGIRVPMIVAWPGKIAPKTRSQALVQSTDFYPTLLELHGWQKKPNQIFDGVSFAPALKGEEFTRDPIITYFPHAPLVPDWIPPSIALHEKNWKLIREFHQGEEGAHRYRLFDLATDLGETKNLAADYPETVVRLSQKLDAFIEEAQVILPVPNPSFDPDQYRPELEGIGKKRG